MGTMGLVLKGQTFMFLLFFLMFLTMLRFFLPVMFRYKGEEVIAVRFLVKLIVFHKRTQLHQIFEMDVDALQKDEHGERYGKQS